MAVLIAVLASVDRADGFQVASPIHTGCHERLLYRAMKQARTTPGSPGEVTEEDEVLAHALQFDVSNYGKDLATISLMVGVRYNDLHGAQAVNLGEVVPVHNRDEFQREHCLRSASHDGQSGAVAAIAECRNFMEDMVMRALDGHDIADPNPTQEVEVYLRFRAGQPVVRVSRLYFNLGRAIHALQDSFTHTFRAEDLGGGSAGVPALPDHTARETREAEAEADPATAASILARAVRADADPGASRGREVSSARAESGLARSLSRRGQL